MSNNESIKEKTSLEYNLTLINEFIDSSNSEDEEEKFFNIN